MSKYPLVFLLVLGTKGVFADDFKAIDGKEYKNVTVSRVEPDGIVLTSSSGISKVYFTELPKEVQERFHYDAEKAAAYSAQQNANLEALRKQQQEAQRQAAEAKAKNNKYAGEQLAARQGNDRPANVGAWHLVVNSANPRLRTKPEQEKENEMKKIRLCFTMVSY